MARLWLSSGIDDPNLIVLAVSTERADLWDSPNHAVVRFRELAVSIAAARPIGLSDHEVFIPRGRIAATL